MPRPTDSGNSLTQHLRIETSQEFLRGSCLTTHLETPHQTKSPRPRYLVQSPRIARKHDPQLSLTKQLKFAAMMTFTHDDERKKGRESRAWERGQVNEEERERGQASSHSSSSLITFARRNAAVVVKRKRTADTRNDVVQARRTCSPRG